MKYIDKNGKTCNVYNISNERQKAMERNGWRCECVLDYNENEQQLYNRLSERYEYVNVYWCGTMIRGIRQLYAYCK